MSGRLLLVEDEDAIRKIARVSLERVGGWSVVSAASGGDALRLADAEGPFDVVLLDVMMPGLDGPDTLRALRDGALPEHAAIVFMTAKTGEAEAARLRGLGAAGVIAKPFDPMTLPARLDEILAGA